MVQHLIVPVDGSDYSWRAFDVAHAIAKRCKADLRVIEIVSDPADGRRADAQLRDELDRRGPFDVEVIATVRLSVSSVASEIEGVTTRQPGAIVVMASHGRGRSAAIVGSVAEDVLRRTFGPIILVGPHVEPDDFSGPVVVSVDGSQESEAALPLAVAWATELQTAPWIVNVIDPRYVAIDTDDLFESAYPARLAKTLQWVSGPSVQFDELHGRDPVRAVVDYATRHEASLIIASSHGRSGLSRLAMGSVASGFVRHATCPVVVVRLPDPNPAHSTSSERQWAY